MILNVKKIIKLELILSLAIAFFTLCNQSRLVSICFYASFLIIILATLIVIRKKSSYKILFITTSLTAVASVLWSMIDTEKTLSMDNIVYILVFISLLFYLYLVLEVEVDYQFVKWIIVFGLIFSICFPALYYFGGLKEYKAGYLSMNFSNSNLLGMWLVQAIVFAIIGFFWYKSIVKKVICLILVTANIQLLVLSGSRNALLSLMLAGIIVVLHLLLRSKYSKVLFLIVSIAPIIFLFVYMGTYAIWNSSDIMANFFENIDKGIDTRYLIWQESFYHMKGYFLTGCYFKLAGNLHNSHLVVWASYGIITLVLTVIYLYKIMIKTNENCETMFQKICMAGFFTTLFMGMGEGALFSGAVGLYIPACIYIVLARYEGRYSRKE